ncbi:type I toxin-antitoxin system Fst family toxin [Enterococcus hulanensis]|nr:MULTISPECIES: type I toxin-antitoxin system Fst family toxin [Enterococcus]MBO0411505.1 type I toxin-antitoxin system Fst family toxin [Enterococcus hulanensis]
MGELVRYVLAPVFVSLVIALFKHWLSGRDP